MTVKVEMEGYCPLVKLKPNKANGYIQISWGGANHFTTLGDLLLWSKGERIDREVKNPLQCSHLCHNPACSDPRHVVIETAKENNGRKGCLVFVACPHHEKHFVPVCEHRPPCIKAVGGLTEAKLKRRLCPYKK